MFSGYSNESLKFKLKMYFQRYITKIHKIPTVYGNSKDVILGNI